MRILFVSALLLAGFIRADAQKYNGRQRDPKPSVEYLSAIHFNPFALVQIDFTILAGVEYRPKPGIGLVTEIGYIFASGYLGNDGNGAADPASGFIIRPSARFYVNDRKTFYLQPQIFYKQVTHKQSDWIGKDCVNGIPSYEAFEDYKYRRQVFGGNATAGVLVPLSRKQTSFIDFYFGLGVRYKTGKIVQQPRSCIEEDINGTVFTSEDGTFPSLPLGIKLVFAIQ